VHAALADPVSDDGGALASEDDVDVDEEEGEDEDEDDVDREDELLSPLDEPPLLQAPPMSAAARQATTTPTARVPRIGAFSVHWSE
jgi:hypothetical protein